MTGCCINGFYCPSGSWRGGGICCEALGKKVLPDEVFRMNVPGGFFMSCIRMNMSPCRKARRIQTIQKEL